MKKSERKRLCGSILWEIKAWYNGVMRVNMLCHGGLRGLHIYRKSEWKLDLDKQLDD